LGFSNWPVILLHQLHANKLSSIIITAPSNNNQVFWHRCRGLNYIFPRQLRASETPSKFSGDVAGEKENFCKGSFARTSFILF
jgi:hypothetical protein